MESLLESKLEEEILTDKTAEININSEDEINRAVHRIIINYEREPYDPTDTAQEHQSEYAQDKLEVYFLEDDKPKTTFGFSYLGSGVMKDAYNTVFDEFRNAADKWEEAPTPESAGKLLLRILGEAVMRAGDHIDPDTKERMLFWMKTPEGMVWRAFYEVAATVKTPDYNFTHLS
jgi:hypothetical protein